MDESILELMNRRQRQILVHSYIYYELNDSLIPDITFDKWSMELAQLIQDYPEEYKKSAYFQAFYGFDGSSGFDLPYRSPEVVNTAHRLMSYFKK